MTLVPVFVHRFSSSSILGIIACPSSLYQRSFPEVDIHLLPRSHRMWSYWRLLVTCHSNKSIDFILFFCILWITQYRLCFIIVLHVHYVYNLILGFPVIVLKEFISAVLRSCFVLLVQDPSILCDLLVHFLVCISITCDEISNIIADHNLLDGISLQF